MSRNVCETQVAQPTKLPNVAPPGRNYLVRVDLQSAIRETQYALPCKVIWALMTLTYEYPFAVPGCVASASPSGSFRGRLCKLVGISHISQNLSKGCVQCHLCLPLRNFRSGSAGAPGITPRGGPARISRNPAPWPRVPGIRLPSWDHHFNSLARPASCS